MTNRSERIPQLDNNFTKPAYTISEVSPQRAIQVGGGQTGTSNQSEAQLSPVRRPWINDRTQSQPITAMNKFDARVDQDNEPVQIPTVNTQLTANLFRENSQNLRKQREVHLDKWNQLARAKIPRGRPTPDTAEAF